MNENSLPSSSTSTMANIWLAAGEGNLEKVKEYIEQDGLSPNALDDNNYNPLHAAASWNHPEILRYLVEKGGDINIADDDGETPLFVVEQVGMARLIVELGGHPNHRNLEGVTVSLLEDLCDQLLNSLERPNIGGAITSRRLPSHFSFPSNFDRRIKYSRIHRRDSRNRRRPRCTYRRTHDGSTNNHGGFTEGGVDRGRNGRAIARSS